MIQINNLSKKYKGTDFFSVKELDLTISEEEIFGLLGPNGAGKTTLISMLSSILKPSSGTFSIDGLDYSKNPKELKQLIGTVPQEYALYPSLTALENLMYFGSMYGIKSRELKKDIQDHLETLGLSQFAGKKIKTYSGGMKRRVNLIAGILHRPKVLFLDEPTVGVDKNGTTIIYTSHHLNEAEEFCTRVAIIDQGTIVCKGEPKQLIAEQKDARHLEDVFLALTGKALRDYA